MYGNEHVAQAIQVGEMVSRNGVRDNLKPSAGALPAERQ